MGHKIRKMRSRGWAIWDTDLLCQEIGLHWNGGMGHIESMGLLGDEYSKIYFHKKSLQNSTHLSSIDTNKHLLFNSVNCMCLLVLYVHNS